MGTISKIIIKHSCVEDIVDHLDTAYIVKQKVIKIDSMNCDEFLESKGNRTFVVFEEKSGWIQLSIDLQNLYEFDELLRRFTEIHNTIAFIGYNQTTSGDFRFALFENGQMKRSIVQRYFDHINQRRIMDNFGKKRKFESIDLGKAITREMNKEDLLDYETLNDWYVELGFVGEFKEGVEYIHLEIEDFKN